MTEDESAARKKRNQVKRNKFFQLKDEISQSHPHITEWFKDTSRRSLQTEIIENCFKPGVKGGWKLDLANPFFKESKTRCVCVGSMGACGEKHVFSFGGVSQIAVLSKHEI